MLSGVKLVDRTEAERRHKEERKKEKKERKKHKKEKRSKHKRRDESSDGGGGGSSSDGGGAIGRRGRRREQWEDPSDSGSDSEGGGGPSGAGGSGAQREDWMTKPMARQKTDEQLAAEEEERAAKEAEARRRDPDQPFVSKRELNPYLRDGGSGVPPEAPAEGGAAPAPAQRAAGVGDGGASWRLKALKRAQQQAESEGKKVNEIVSERWGSLTELTAGLTERRAAHGMAHVHSARDRRRADPEFAQRQDERRRMREGVAEEGGEEGSDKAAYLSEMKSGRSQMRRPQEGGSLSWRRPDSRSSSGRDSRGEERRRDERGGRDERSGRDDGDRRRDERGGREDDRRGERRRDDRGGERRRDERPPRPRHDPLGHGQDAAALRAAAGELNQFKGDGSFLEQFEQRRQEEAREAEERRQWEATQASRGAEGDRPGGGMEVQPSASEDSSDEDSEAARERERREMLGQQGGRPSMAAAMAAERASLAARPAAPAAADGSGGAAEGEAGPAAPRPGSAAEQRPGPAGGGNLSAAALLRARLTGKAPPAPAAAAAEDQSQAQAQQQDQQDEGRPKQETVVLPQIDSRGRAVPGAFGREEAGAGLPGAGDRKQKRTQRYEDGERSRYFADDHDTDLQTLIKRTKHGEEGDVDRRLAAGIMRSQRYKQADFDADAEYDHDAGLEHLERRGVVGKKGGREKETAREKQRQIRDYQRHTSALEACRLCFASASRPRQLTLAIGQSSYLALPARGRLVPGHCVIVPADHVASTRQVDEQVWTELRNFKKCLIQMFMKQGQEVIFFETATQLGSARSHAAVECVPVPPKAAGKAPMFFKKAIDDATSEWAQHHAKRYIDTKAKGLRGSIPPNFPYLHVEFGIADGFVHVIDDETNFDKGLARSVLIGLLGLPQEDMHRRARQESPQIQQQWADEFRKQFEPYDWTRQLG